MMTKNNEVGGVPAEARDYQNLESAWKLWYSGKDACENIVKIFDNLDGIGVDEKTDSEDFLGAMRTELLGLFEKTCMANEILGRLPVSMKKYFDHDAASFARLSDELGADMVKDLSGMHSGNTDKARWDEIRKLFVLWNKQAVQFFMVAEDLLLRSVVSGYDMSRRDIDYAVPAGQIIEAFDAMCATKRYLGAQVKYVPSREVVASLYLTVPHGTIFNFVQNCVSNAAFAEFMAQKIELTAGVEGGDLVLEVRDNGVGIKREKKEGDLEGRYTGEMIDIFGEGTTGKKQSGRGLGIAHAGQRFASLGASVSVESSYYRANRSEGDDPAEGDGTTFVLRVPILEKSNTQQ